MFFDLPQSGSTLFVISFLQLGIPPKIPLCETCSTSHDGFRGKSFPVCKGMDNPCNGRLTSYLNKGLYKKSPSI